MSRNLPAGSVHDLIADVIEVTGGKRVAADLGVDRSTLSRWSDPDEANGRKMAVTHLDALARLHPAAAAVVAAHFANLAGGAFLPEVGAPGSLHRACADLDRAGAALAAALLEAMDEDSDGGSEITAEEARGLDARADSAIASGRRIKSAISRIRAPRDAAARVTVRM